MQTSKTEISSATVEALLNLGRRRMVQALINEGGLADPQQMHTHWKGFASCAAVLLDQTGDQISSRDAESHADSTVEAALARLPVNPERLSLADMKRHMWAQGVDFASDLIADRNINAVVQLQDGVRPAIKQDHKHGVASVDALDGGGLHGESPVGVDPPL